MTLKLIFVAIILRVCNTSILIRFGKVPSHYLKNYLKKDSYTADDPFEHFELRERQELCDVAINAKQFIVQYPAKYYAERSGRPISSLTTWDPQNTVFNDTTNYQRSLPSPSNPDPECLHYLPHSVSTQGHPQYVHVKAVQCVNTMNVKWYLTFGWVDNCMYLLENGHCKKSPSLLVTGIFDPGAFVANRPPAYFVQKFRTSAAMMKSYCRLGLDDTLRLCSAVFDALDKDDIRAQKNYMEKIGRACTSKKIKVSESSTVRTDIIRCTIFSEQEREDGTSKTKTTRFFALADSGDRYAVFVLFQRGAGELELGARVTEIAALMNPVGHKHEKSRKSRAATDSDEEDDRPKEEFEERPRKKETPTRTRSHQKLKEPVSRWLTRERESENENEKKVVKRSRSKRKQNPPTERKNLRLDAVDFFEEENEECSRSETSAPKNTRDTSREKRRTRDDDEAVTAKRNEKNSQITVRKEPISESLKTRDKDNVFAGDGIEISSGRLPKVEKLQEIEDKNRKESHDEYSRTFETEGRYSTLYTRRNRLNEGNKKQ